MNLFTEGTNNILMLLISTGPVVKAVLLLLIFMSVFSWAIIYSKFRLLRSSSRKSDAFLKLYHSNEDIKALLAFSEKVGGPVAELFRAGYAELVKTAKKKNPEGTEPKDISSCFESVDLLERALNRAMTKEASKLEKSLVFLATTGSSAPFIGLFGTVWGIMNSFIGLAGNKGVPSLEVVAPGIAEALIATAIGLAAAIPATIAYNYFVNRVRAMEVEMENFCAGFLNTAERYLNR
ncbi:MAG: protein TolQ [Candidatus Dadabacteria bacterium]|nr:protein TolQ [Candidatus Dadabacteria bacterium]